MTPADDPPRWLCPRCRTRVVGHDAVRCRVDGWRLVRDRTGSRVGRFTLEGFLGVGANGSVWRAADEVGHPVAVKLLLPRVPAEAQRFDRGARLAQGLDHPHVARTFGVGRLTSEEGELLYLDMELLDGETLAARLTHQPRLSAEASARLVVQALHALEHVHARGIVHRDLKPSNLFLEREPADNVKILDFGIAKPTAPTGLTGRTEGSVVGPFLPDAPDEAVEAEAGGAGLEHEEVTGQHKICGTPEYMAPEQIVGARPDARSDLYALGVVLHKALTGQLPFRGRTRAELYQQHLQAAPPPLPPDVEAPPALAAVVARALAKAPDDRFPSARAMREALAAAVGLPSPRLAPTPDAERPPPLPARAVDPRVDALPPRTRSRRRALAIGFFVASAIALAAAVVMRLG
ncbi:MAG: serine/threonine protein kinase [Deltaproteobacteria bacterium]|nr:serine/threonine protein kinase [Deltaproteobacteria bacterium]